MFKKVREIACDVKDLPVLLSTINRTNKEAMVSYDYVTVIEEGESYETWMARFRTTNREWIKLISNFREIGTLEAMLDDDGSIWYIFKGEA